MLNDHRARALHQPLSRSALIQLLGNQPVFDQEQHEDFNGQDCISLPLMTICRT